MIPAENADAPTYRKSNGTSTKPPNLLNQSERFCGAHLHILFSRMVDVNAAMQRYKLQHLKADFESEKQSTDAILDTSLTKVRHTYHLIGSGVETAWLQAMCRLDSTCTAPTAVRVKPNASVHSVL
jgi:dTDP-4-amino-4,6-dideoxygalactose transaminase